MGIQLRRGELWQRVGAIAGLLVGFAVMYAVAYAGWWNIGLVPAFVFGVPGCLIGSTLGRRYGGVR